MSDEKKKNTMETTTLTEVPMEERKSWISVAFMQAGIMICVPSLLLGGILAGAMPLHLAIISGINLSIFSFKLKIIWEFQPV